MGPTVRVNILLPSSKCQCCGRTHYLHMQAIFHRDTLPTPHPHPPGYVNTSLCRTGGGVTRWRSWLRHCATSQKVAGSISGGVIGIFLLHNPSGRTMTLGLTQPLTEMNTRYISSGGKGGRCVRLTNLLPSCADCLEIWEPQPPGTLRACPGL